MTSILNEDEDIENKNNFTMPSIRNIESVNNNKGNQ